MEENLVEERRTYLTARFVSQSRNGADDRAIFDNY